VFANFAPSKGATELQWLFLRLANWPRSTPPDHWQSHQRNSGTPTRGYRQALCPPSYFADTIRAHFPTLGIGVDEKIVPPSKAPELKPAAIRTRQAHAMANAAARNIQNEPRKNIQNTTILNREWRNQNPPDSSFCINAYSEKRSKFDPTFVNRLASVSE
jgi:hypothetical protein